MTALDVQPAIVAIREHYDRERASQRIREFTGEMARLSAELDGRE